MRLLLLLAIVSAAFQGEARDYSAAPSISFDQPVMHRKLRQPKPANYRPANAADPAEPADLSSLGVSARPDPAPALPTASDDTDDTAPTATATNAFSPHARGTADPTALVVKTIAGARTDICAAAYSFTSAPIADALLAARARGVAVRLTLDKSQARGRHLMLTRLQQAGLPVRVDRHYAIMHDKFMVIDERVLQLGSFNYTKSAETKNAENVLVIRRYKKVIASYQTECERLWDEADEPATLPNLTLQRK